MMGLKIRILFWLSIQHDILQEQKIVMKTMKGTWNENCLSSQEFVIWLLKCPTFSTKSRATYHEPQKIDEMNFNNLFFSKTALVNTTKRRDLNDQLKEFPLER